jgi:hypothetical protein
MKILNFLFIILIGIFLFIPMVSAVSYVSESRGATMKDTFRVSLGIENVAGMTLTKALFYYNWISLGFLFLIGAMSSKRMTRFFAILIPIFAAMFVWMGWMNAPNPTMTWGVILMCGLMAVVTYMKGSLKENYGGGGPGSLIINIVFYLIILQTCVGIINATQVWETNFAPTPENQQFAPNADLTQSINTATNTGGWLSVIASSATTLTDMALGGIKLLISIIISIAAFSITINSIFPFFAENPLGLLMLGAIQLGIWFVYALFIAVIFGKVYPDTVAF